MNSLRLCASMLLAFLAGCASVPPAPTPAQQKELDAARADLEKAAQRLAELHRKYGGTEGPMRIEKRVLRKPVIGAVAGFALGGGALPTTILYDKDGKEIWRMVGGAEWDNDASKKLIEEAFGA